MKEFFKVTPIEEVIALAATFGRVGEETVPIEDAWGRVLAEAVRCEENVPDFTRSTMDGYAVQAASTFGASEANPALLQIVGSVEMGVVPRFSVGPGEAAGMPTGGMLPEGAESVVMIEHTEALDPTTVEVYRSVAPLANVVQPGEDLKEGDVLLTPGTRLRPQDLALLAAMGRPTVKVHLRPRVGIISTGDEVAPVDGPLPPGKIRDMNTYALCGLCRQHGAVPVPFGIVGDDEGTLLTACEKAVESCDTVLVSGGSSVGTRDHTIEVLQRFPDSRVLVHGISISPGKPTILAGVGPKAVWGLPGHVVSAMVVFGAVVRPFLDHLAGCSGKSVDPFSVTARLTRNVPSVQGRVDFVRARVHEKEGALWADPLFGKSGLIRTMVRADGLIRVDINDEGIAQGAMVRVYPF